MLAPIIMGYIGKEKQANGVNAGGLGDLLGGIFGVELSNKLKPNQQILLMTF